MKKLLAASVAGILVCASVFAQKVSLTNTFGANDDNTGNGDFLEFNRKVKNNGDFPNYEKKHLSLQAVSLSADTLPVPVPVCMSERQTFVMI